MSFNPFAFESSIYTRLNTGAIAAACQGVWNTKAPPGIKVSQGGDPYIIFELFDGTFDPMTFEHNIAEASYRVSVYDHMENGNAPSHALIALIYGNSEGTDNAPTYGLARWKIPAVTDIATSSLRPGAFGTQHSEDQLHYWMTFTVEVQEA